MKTSFPLLLVCTVVVSVCAATAQTCNDSTSGTTPGCSSTQQKSIASPVSAHSHLAASAYNTLPLNFELNQGQTDTRVRYLARVPGYNLFLTSSGAVMAWSDFQAGASSQSEKHASSMVRRNTRGMVLNLSFSGANPKAHVQGLDMLSGKSNYFIGNDPSKWRTNIPNYDRVAERNLYRGIDLLYYGNKQQLEFDFVIAPGSDARQIEWSFAGQQGLHLTLNGELVIQTAEGDLIEQRPVIYQNVNGTKQGVAGHYVLRSADRVGFEIGPYDKSRTLIIDPVLRYSTYLGGAAFNPAVGMATSTAEGIAVDSAENAYVVGETTATDFPTTPGAYDITSAGGGYVTFQYPLGVVFVTKINPTGTGLVYSTYIGGNSESHGQAIAIDPQGNAYVTGHTASSNYPTTPGAFQPAYHGADCGSQNAICDADAFVTKLNPSGSALVYSSFLGGTDFERGMGIIADSTGNAYVTGTTESLDFPIANAIQPVYGADPNCYPGKANRCPNGFISKVNPSGTSLLFSTYFGAGNEEGNAITLDPANNIFSTGTTWASHFRTTHTFGPSTEGLPRGFVVKLTNSGASLLYSSTIAGAQSNAIAVDSYGQAFIAGEVAQSDAPNFPTTTNAFQRTYQGGLADAFVTKLSSTGAALQYSTYLGGNDFDLAYGIGIDNYGHAYIAGTTQSLNFPTTPNAFQKSRRGQGDAFVTNLDSAGKSLIYSTLLGGSNYEDGFAIAVDRAWNVYLTGDTSSTDFPVTPGAPQSTFKGHSDAFVSKIVIASDLAISQTASPTPVPHGSNLTYTVKVTNTGPDNGNQVVVTDSLPTSTSFVSVGTSSGSCSHPAVGGTGTVNCSTSILPAGSTVSVTLVVHVNATSGSTLSNTAKVNSNSQDLNQGNNTTTLHTNVD